MLLHNKQYSKTGKSTAINDYKHVDYLNNAKLFQLQYQYLNNIFHYYNRINSCFTLALNHYIHHRNENTVNIIKIKREHFLMMHNRCSKYSEKRLPKYDFSIHYERRPIIYTALLCSRLNSDSVNNHKGMTDLFQKVISCRLLTGIKQSSFSSS